MTLRGIGHSWLDTGQFGFAHGVPRLLIRLCWRRKGGRWAWLAFCADWIYRLNLNTSVWEFCCNCDVSTVVSRCCRNSGHDGVARSYPVNWNVTVFRVMRLSECPISPLASCQLFCKFKWISWNRSWKCFHFSVNSSMQQASLHFDEKFKMVLGIL